MLDLLSINCTVMLEMMFYFYISLVTSQKNGLIAYSYPNFSIVLTRTDVNLAKFWRFLADNSRCNNSEEY